MKKVEILNGLGGFFILVAVLLSVVAFLGFNAWQTQKAQANNPYTLEYKEIKAKSADNSQYYKLSK